MLRRTMATADAPLFAQLDRRWFFPVLCALLLVPQFLNTPPNRNAWVIRPGLPLITSGDEPHYLTLLHSLIEDGDFDVKNNYDEAARGGRQSGIRRAGRPQTDRHVGFYAGEVFVGQPGPPPVTPPPELLPPPGHPEYSTHPPGLPLFLGNLDEALKEALKLRGGTGWLKDGDIVCFNDPYIQGTHLNDLTMFGPVFFGGEIMTPRVHGLVADLLDEVAAGSLQVVLDRTFPLAEAAAAHAFIESRQAFGRVVLIP